MIIDTYCQVFTLRLIVRLTKINFLIERLIVIKNFNRTAALVVIVTVFNGKFVNRTATFGN